MSSTLRCAYLLRVRCSCFVFKKHNLLTNESNFLLPTKNFMSISSLREPLKLCAIANRNTVLTLGSTLTLPSVKPVRLALVLIRDYAASVHHVTDAELKQYMESLSDSFMETRELLDDARNSFGSVYFNEDLQEAEESLNDTLERYTALLEKLSDSQKEQVQRSIGLKMEELKAQRQIIQDIIRED